MSGIEATSPSTNAQALFNRPAFKSVNMDHAPHFQFGASHLSEWCALSKANFLQAIHDGDAHEWTVVMGNEAGGMSKASKFSARAL